MPAFVTDILNWYKATGLQAATITIPVIELVVLLLALALCLLLRFSRTGLIVAFLFAYRWGWRFCLHASIIDQQMRTPCLSGYIVFGILVLTLSIIAMTVSNHARGD